VRFPDAIQYGAGVDSTSALCNFTHKNSPLNTFFIFIVLSFPEIYDVFLADTLQQSQTPLPPCAPG